VTDAGPPDGAAAGPRALPRRAGLATLFSGVTALGADPAPPNEADGGIPLGTTATPPALAAPVEPPAAVASGATSASTTVPTAASATPVAAPDALEGSGLDATAAPTSAPRPSAAPGETRDEWSGFAKYRPNYFITGFRNVPASGHDPDVKFQISLRYELLMDPPGRWHFMLAYTQKSFWNIYDSSAPFRENNYNPELFIQWDPHLAPLEYVKAGYAHESNGLGGDASRSWDRVFAEARFGTGALTVYPVFWVPFRLSDNPDIKRSFGWGELMARLRLGANYELEAVGRVGNQFDRGNILVGLNIGSLLRMFGVTEQKWFTPNFYLQGWHGYGESLIDYDVRTTAIRAGIILRR